MCIALALAVLAALLTMEALLYWLLCWLLLVAGWATERGAESDWSAAGDCSGSTLVSALFCIMHMHAYILMHTYVI